MPTFAPGRWTVESPKPVTDTDRPLILVVDDHDDSRAIARVVLESGGYRVADAATGCEAIRLVKAEIPDAILLDLILPEMDGWQVARELRSDLATSEIVIIAMTALGDYEAHERALNAGCRTVLLKPVSPRLILRTLNRFLGPAAPAIRAPHDHFDLTRRRPQRAFE
jgi:CheY-like chemotaxis protein